MKLIWLTSPTGNGKENLTFWKEIKAWFSEYQGIFPSASFLVGLLGALAAILIPPLFGQQPPTPHLPLETTEDSARWWTLTDDITPQQLRAIHKDIALHKERYWEAVKAGIQTPLPKEQMERLSFFIDGQTHPQLFEMWSVFSSFAAGFEYDMVDPRVDLAAFGFGGEVLETIVAMTIEFWNVREELQEKVGEEMKAVAELARLSKERLGKKNYDAAIQARDAHVLSSVTGYSVERVEKLLKLWWEETPTEDLTVQTLPLIKEALGPADWDRFRRYLLEVQAPRMSASRFARIEED